MTEIIHEMCRMAVEHAVQPLQQDATATGPDTA
jgi:hypothetical protein